MSFVLIPLKQAIKKHYLIPHIHSYTKQIITFTFPHVGIVGTNQEDQESKKIYAVGCIINQPLSEYSNWRAENDLNSYFLKNKIPCIFGIDTRYLTKKLSVEGAKKAAIIHFGEGENKIEKLKTQINEWKGLQNLDLAGIVSTEQNYNWKKGIWKSDKSIKNQFKYNVTCLDFGIKNNILRNLNEFNLNPTVLNLFSSYEEIIETNPSGIFLSNGPGDPYATGSKIVDVIKKLIDDNIPIFGICLGHHLVIRPSFTLGGTGGGVAYDDEGLRHKHLPVFSVQYHPEASPGPHDSHYLFEEFYKLIEKNAKKN